MPGHPASTVEPTPQTSRCWTAEARRSGLGSSRSASRTGSRPRTHSEPRSRSVNAGGLDRSSAVRRQRRSGKLAYILAPAWSGNIRIWLIWRCSPPFGKGRKPGCTSLSGWRQRSRVSVREPPKGAVAIVDVGGPEALRLVIDEVQTDDPYSWHVARRIRLRPLPVDTCHRLGARNAEGANHLPGDAPTEGKGLMVASAGKLAVRAKQGRVYQVRLFGRATSDPGPINADFDFVLHVLLVEAVLGEE